MEVEHEDGGAEVVDNDADCGPHSAPRISASSAIYALQRSNRAQAQRGEWLPSVQSVAVIGAFDGVIGKQDFFVWIARDNPQGVLHKL